MYHILIIIMTIFIIKLFASIFIVVGLSIITERLSPRVAGILSGYPTGSALTLFFFGLEIGPDFAAKSAIYNMLGLIAMQSFIFFYYKFSQKFNIVYTSIFSILGYFIVIWLLHFFHIQKIIIVLVITLFTFFFIYLLRKIPDTKIVHRVQLTRKIILLRALMAASVIVLVTSVAKFVGPRWSGLFSAFPALLFPLILIIHINYKKEHVHTLIKNVPIGIFSLILYSLSVSIVYPLYGIYRGTIISFVVATIYLLFYQYIHFLKK